MVPLDTNRIEQNVATTPPPAMTFVPEEIKPTTFKEYISTLEPWEQKSLHQCEDLIHTTDFHTALLQNDKLYVVSDGGAIPKKGSFGWVIGTESEVISQGKGHITGSSIYSFRSEGGGRLAVFCYITRFIMFFGIPLTSLPCFNTFIDNKSVLDREREALGGIRTADTLRPDFDIIAQLVEVRKRLPLRTKSTHVSGHQDKHKRYDELDRQSQLNVLADELATSALRQHQCQTRPPESFPACTAYLHTTQGCITCKDRDALLWAATAPQMESYLQRRHNWSPQTFKCIDWDCHGRAYQQQGQGMQRFITKFAMGWLPTGVREKRCGAPSEACVLCSAPETLDHLLRCKHKHQWRAQFLNDISNHLKISNTAADVRTELLSGIDKWLQAQPTDKGSPQTEIGWGLLLRGYLHKDYTHKMDKFFSDQPELDPKTHNGTRWGTNLIKFCWQEIHKLWKLRCHLVHSQAHYVSSRLNRFKLLTAAKTIFASATDFTAEHRQLLDIGLSAVLNMKTSDLAAWVHSSQKILEASRKEQLRITHENHDDIRKFFILVDRGKVISRMPPSKSGTSQEMATEAFLARRHLGLRLPNLWSLKQLSDDPTSSVASHKKLHSPDMRTISDLPKSETTRKSILSSLLSCTHASQFGTTITIYVIRQYSSNAKNKVTNDSGDSVKTKSK